MEAVIQTKGLLSLPSNPKTRPFRPSQPLKSRFLTTKPIKSHLTSSSLSPDGPRQNPIPKTHGFLKNRRNLHLRRVESAAAADQPAYIEESEKPKFLGVEIITLKKIIPLGLMFFCILFNYTILRDTKDVLVVTAKGSSAEIIPFLKTWVNLPMAVGFMFLYAKLSNVLSKEALFYSVIFPFIGFFGAFGFLLYPLSDMIHPTGLADKLVAALGPSFLGPVAILRIWSFCLFYVMAELWGSVVISVLFWGFANQITTVDEAKQFYPLFGLGANVALIFSGRTVKYFSNLRKNLPPGVDGWAISLKGMMSIVVLLGLVICGIYWGVNTFVLNDPSLPKANRKKKEKPKLDTKEGMKFLLSSRYIRDLATLVVAYGISINLVEVTWKSKLKAQFPSPNEYSSFMGDFSTATGIATFTMMLLSRVILRRYGWGVAAMITPTVLLITGVAFFSLILFGEPLAPIIGSFGITPLLAAVYVGALQNIFSKSAKYSLFDPCKEMAYIPLDEDTKVKGKAAIDVVCNPLGKSGGALIQQFMILTFGSLANSTPYLGGILLVIVLAWLAAARSLDKQFTSLAKEDLLQEQEATPIIKKAAIDVSPEATNGSVGKEEMKAGNGSLREPSNGSALKDTAAEGPEISPKTNTPGTQ
ncbi:ADP,ATP carrier protein 1, chloroplastic-like [Magnolia sinica]|uniref:ADP,ATP carrier protein 1, chloroplastic-like n=1 Tax=Magnolia sinica TaxID=86752 RepID=UPI002659A75B|nr:ADP,ATP carrier protein 1, chloroplastic-like [Magnolia sinica]